MKTLIAATAGVLMSFATVTNVVAGSVDDSWSSDDNYGSVLFDEGASKSTAIQPGVGDAYGSVLFDEATGTPGSDPQPGHADNYGSILLDI